MENLRTMYNQFLVLRENLPEGKHVARKYVDEFHRLLNMLEKANSISLKDYYIDDSILEYTAGIATSTGSRWLGEKQCERAFLSMKIDGILLLFVSEEKPPMGFRAPNNE
jgi:hypothetical protein